MSKTSPHRLFASHLTWRLWPLGITTPTSLWVEEAFPFLDWEERKRAGGETRGADEDGERTIEGGKGEKKWGKEKGGEEIDIKREEKGEKGWEKGRKGGEKRGWREKRGREERGREERENSSWTYCWRILRSFEVWSIEMPLLSDCVLMDYQLPVKLTIIDPGSSKTTWGSSCILMNSGPISYRRQLYNKAVLT